ncbi:hypothetical protein LLEC1_04348 [Akanthomyces lecanii]|uniref:Potassium transport protein n=1 Tax=Cordyceps confragosa TaxID=2714763 RepID=A0A179I4S0_CORDF|nr:hypothetical protein LLEC1_04348 [Akanthomyces lecanii]
MLRLPVNFVTLHSAYIIFMGLLALVVMCPGGNMAAIDAYFFGASASTESGLNTTDLTNLGIDVKELYTYQQLYIYFIPIFTNLGFINIIVVIVRLHWFKKHLKRVAPRFLAFAEDEDANLEDGYKSTAVTTSTDATGTTPDMTHASTQATAVQQPVQQQKKHAPSSADQEDTEKRQHIAFDASAEKDTHPRNNTVLYIPGPRDRDHGRPFVEMNKDVADKRDDMTVEPVAGPSVQAGLRRRADGQQRIGETLSMERATSIATSMFVIGADPTRARRVSTSSQQAPRLNDMPFLSREATVGRNSNFRNLTSKRPRGAWRYRVSCAQASPQDCYFFGLHLFGAICLVGWVQYANPKYTDYLASVGQDKNWWAFYSSQTMISNLGFTLTPDSMISFRDAGWPMFVMSFLAFAGNTLYPVFLRLIIWTMSRICPRNASVQQPLAFLLDHPRRCYMLLFPSGATWALFGIIFVLNFVDTLLIIVLDLNNSAVSELPLGQRILAAIFQAASSRHTGTATFNLADVNPAVQFSLLVMMYIAIFPIAMAVRVSNTYEERSLGVYESDGQVNEQKGSAYLLTHMQNQLSFDLWYMFLGIFCICVAESRRIMDADQPAFAVFPIFFEVVSAYGNVGLSLGYPTVATSLSGQFNIFSKLVICAMMIRGRHRGLPYQLDRAVMLPGERRAETGDLTGESTEGKE